MGNNQTRADSPYTTSIAPFSPTSGTPNRNNYFQQTERTCLALPTFSAVPISPPFHGVWSVIRPSEYPISRYGSCYVYDPQTESLIIGYGVNSNSNSSKNNKIMYFNDLWRLDLISCTWEL